jgi:uncharacterized protein
MQPSIQQIIDWLQLQGPTTCGLVSEPYCSAWQLPQSALPPGYSGSRSLGNAFYFLVTPTAPVQLHRIRSDQMYHHYLGAPLEVLLLYADGRSEVRRVAGDVTPDVRPQLFIPGGTFHAARVTDGGEYALLGTSVWLRAEADDVELADPERLREHFPQARAEILSFAGGNNSQRTGQ